MLNNEETQIDTNNFALSEKKRSRSHTERQEDGDPVEKIPLFLRKTYNMLNECDASIATWSEDGLSLVVKDVDLFTSKILCQCFRHSNFSSFVRQLNLYGFRKVKSDLMTLVSGQSNNIESKYCTFKHEHFQRGRPDLLYQIRKTSQSTEAADKSELEKLRLEVKELKVALSTMSVQLNELSSLSNNLMLKNDIQASAICELSSLVNNLTMKNNQPHTSVHEFIPQEQQDCTAMVDSQIASVNGATKDISAASMNASFIKWKQENMQRVSFPFQPVATNSTATGNTPSIFKKQNILPTAVEHNFYSSAPASTTLNDETGFSLGG